VRLEALGILKTPITSRFDPATNRPQGKEEVKGRKNENKGVKKKKET
jgi:hypothetical protein